MSEEILARAITACEVCPHNKKGFCGFYYVLIINVPAQGRFCVEYARVEEDEPPP